MNKLLVITVLVALLSINAHSFRVARQVEGEEPETVVAEEPAEEVAEMFEPGAPEETAVAEMAPEEHVVAEVAPEEHVEAEVAPEEHVEAEVAPEEPVVSEVAPEEHVVAEETPEQSVPEVEEPVVKGTLARISDTVVSYYGKSVDTASGYLESIRGLKLEEKAMNLYVDTTRAMSTYGSILQDQLYHVLYPQA